MKEILRRSKFLYLINRLKMWRYNQLIYAFKKANLGNSSYVDPSVQILGWQNVKIGDNSIIGEDSWINISHRKDGSICLTIGDNCFIGRRNFFTTGSFIKIGSYCLTGPNCSFLGADHIYTSPFIPYMASGATSDGYIELGANCWLGANVTILKNVKIGYGSIIGAASVVNQHIPPLSVVVGNPCRIVKRFDVQKDIWVNIGDYSLEVEQSVLNEDEYLDILGKNNCDTKSLLIASSRIFGDI